MRRAAVAGVGFWRNSHSNKVWKERKTWTIIPVATRAIPENVRRCVRCRLRLSACIEDGRIHGNACGHEAAPMDLVERVGPLRRFWGKSLHFQSTKM